MLLIEFFFPVYRLFAGKKIIINSICKINFINKILKYILIKYNYKLLAHYLILAIKPKTNG